MYNAHKKEHDMMEKFRSMVEEYNQEHGLGTNMVTLSASQQRVVDLFNDGHNVLVIGSAGCGKSYLVKELRYQTSKNWPTKRMVVTATTGIAAYNINGITLNSFFGIGTGEHDVQVLIKRVRRKAGIRERLRGTDILVIDEISMASAELFEKIDTICRVIRRNSAPFGGIQVVLTGDLLQLLPVFNKNSSLFPDLDTRLIFESDVFNRYFTPCNTVNLTANFRQNDPQFIGLLLRLRRGAHTAADIRVLEGRLVNTPGGCEAGAEMEDAVHLVSSNKQAQIINSRNLNSVPSKSIQYHANFTEEGDVDISTELTNELRAQLAQKGSNPVTLKKGARVMLTKNLSVEEGLVNGSVGTVERFDVVDGKKMPMVKFDNGVRRLILPVQWELELGTSVSKATQIPLMLCWAITIHRCQSLTLDKAVMDLADCFCHHQMYVALSRVRCLEGLYLKSFDPKKILVHDKVIDFLKSFE